MTYTAVVVIFLLVCVALGVWARGRAERPGFAAFLAAAMVAAQFTLLMWQ